MNEIAPQPAPDVPAQADEVVWITGASSGIGRALALQLAASGRTVAVTARSADGLEALAGEAAGPGTILSYPADVTDSDTAWETVADIEAHYGPIGLAILNAGIYEPAAAVPFDQDLFDRTFAVNVSGTVNCLAPLIGPMSERRNGKIYLMASVAGYSGLPTSAAYGASKAALINMAESLKFDLDRHGVTIGVINPGFVRTPATDKNPFPMPFLMDVDAAARRIMRGVKRGSFEITFPRRFTYILKFLRLLPHWIYFPLVGKATGQNKTPQGRG